MSERGSDRWLSILLSVLVHAAIVGALVWGWWQFRSAPPAPQALTIEASVVHEQAAAAPSAPPPAALAPPAPPAPIPPPPPDPGAAAREAQRQLEEQRATEQRAAEQREAQQREHEENERAEQQRAEAARKAKEELERKAKEDAERKAKEDAERKAQELAQRRSEQERAARESELHSQLAAEEHLNVARASGEQAQYAALIRARIERAWIRPPSAHAGIDCVVHVTQVPGGAVTAVQVGTCNGDQALRESIEAAVYRASPLPAPSDPALFERDLVVNFKPSD